MKNKIFENNQVVIAGEIISGFEYDHEIFGELFYVAYVKCYRLSGNYDVIPIVVSNRLLDMSQDYFGKQICVKGRFSSFNRFDGRKIRLILYVFASEVEIKEGTIYSDNTNQIHLEGYICKLPVYRKTPLGREITDLYIAVNRPYGKTYYIPCIVWDRNAKYASSLNVGTLVMAEGRLQNREYAKRHDDGSFEIRTAYEVSIGKIKTVEEGRSI